jgi:hypothetical protein
VEQKKKEPRRSVDATAPGLKPSQIRASMKKKKVCAFFLCSF